MSFFPGANGFISLSRRTGGGGIPSWVEPGALMDADFENDRFFWNNSAYSDEAAFLSAIGGSQSGVTRTIGPFVDPTETNLLTNGDFASNVDGWSASGSGSSIAWAAGELQATAAGNLNGFSQLVPGVAGRAFRFRGTGRQGTSTNSWVFRAAGGG